MMTSALALNQILALVSRRGKDERFLEATADCLGLSGPESEFEVLRHMVRLVNDIHRDIDALGLDEKTTSTLKSEITPFNGIRNVSQVHSTIHQARSQFLRPEHLVGLTRLHATFAHVRAIPDLSKDAKDLADEFKAGLEKLINSDVPAKLKDDVALHLRQIIAALENYYFFSEKHLDHSLEALVGTFVLNPEETKRHAAVLQPTQKAVGKLLNTMEKTGKYVGIARRLSGDLLAFFSGAI